VTGAIVADVVLCHEIERRCAMVCGETDCKGGCAWPPPDLFAAAAGHAAAAQREESALGRKLDAGLFGQASAGRPWPEHDAALCRDYEREAARSWLFAAQCLLGALLTRRP
jgi:hypothetical protein